jgi:hypothetical protein
MILKTNKQLKKLDEKQIKEREKTKKNQEKENSKRRILRQRPQQYTETTDHVPN